MGIGKWFLKHGPGSPGATAKAVIKDYLKWKQEYPNYNQDELLYCTLLTRVTTGKKFAKISPPSDSTMRHLIRAWRGDIRKLIVYIVVRETPGGENILMNNPQTHIDILSVIEEVFGELNIEGRLDSSLAPGGKE